MARKHFTVTEVERLIPLLERTFTNVIQLRVALRALETKLERAGVNVTREEVLENDGGPIELRRAKALFRAYFEQLGDELEQVQKMGGEVKDLEEGLVDFPGKRGGDDIFLCWKLGEKSVGFWHSADTGFSGRRPIDESVAPEHPRVVD